MSDPRFVRLKSDPRFRRPKKHQSRIVISDRFKAVFSEEGKFGRKTIARVDKYGRPVSRSHEKDNLHRFYRLENAVEPTDKTFVDYARGEVLLQSSDEEDATEDYESSDGSVMEIGVAQTDCDNSEINLNENDFTDLDAQAAAYARDYPEDAHSGESSRTNRLAVVNLDWDHVRAIHLYKICSSLLSPTTLLPSSELSHPELVEKECDIARGRILSVRIYPSQFGKERLTREEKEGPPEEVFKKRNVVEEDEKNLYEIADENDYDEDALRQYQLERLRYYYAIITCDSVRTAVHVYSELEGSELERSANVFDVSFVPDDTTFDEDCCDEAVTNSINYKAVEFVTDALRHSKVKLTWDEDDPERHHATRRTLSRKEIEDADFRAYIASSSSESESDGCKHQEAKQKKQLASREKLRALLLSGASDDLPEGWGRDAEKKGDVDMEITFAPGLSEKAEDQDETTLEKYQRKMREKRKKRKQEAREKEKHLHDEDGKGVAVGDDFFEVEDDGERREVARHLQKGKGKREIAQQVPVDATSRTRTLATPEQLALLITPDNHFDMKLVLKAEKKKQRKHKKIKPDDKADDNEQQDNFMINVNDERFKALNSDHAFAIDPTNPHFKKTKSMVALLEERSRRQEEILRNNRIGFLPTSNEEGERNLHHLVERVKRKTATTEQQLGKRQKV